ncbi:MAG TPA: serine/threonine-protein kinase [Gemmataceae bacterium]|nr:serine/threonine-protein kinase [Gemmataceae bacterium]
MTLGSETPGMALDAAGPALQSVGNYDLVEKIADGGMGTVYKGRHRITGAIVAIKVVAAHMTGNQVLLKRFEQEYVAARQLNHPNIVKALEFGSAGSTPYLVMEFVDGESLGKKLEREGKMPEKEALKLIAQVAQGLHRAHKEKLIHRDVKPDNILVSRDGQAKLADLGLVKEVEADLNLTRTGRGLGTPHFMAPEQFKNAKNVDPRCDIYSLGATLYMMVTGEMPFRSSGPLDAYMKKIDNKLIPPRELNPALSERLDWAIRRAMSPDPEQRPVTCREFVEDLTGRSTRKLVTPENSAPAQLDVWFLVYKDDEGVQHTVKGTTAAIRRSLKEGLLGDASNIRASRSKEGGFDMLRAYPEFRDLVVVPGASPAGALAKTPTVPARSPGAQAPRLGPKKVAARSPEETPTVPVQTALSGKTAPLHVQMAATTPDRQGWPIWIQILLWVGLVAASAAGGMYLLPLFK